MATQQEIRDQITAQIVDMLSKGTVPWRRPWRNSLHAGAPANALTGRAYRGINNLILNAASMKANFQSRWWVTFRQANEMGAHVRRGEKATHVVLFKPVQTKRIDEDGEESEASFRLMRTFCVFNVAQCVGLERLHVGQEPIPAGQVEERFEQAEQVVEATGADIRYGGDRAFYSFDGDFIQMPRREQFAVPEFYDTLFHELAGHWTEHPTRLNWDRTQPENSYAAGELRAELAAVFLAGGLGLPLDQNLPNHAAYLQSWLDKMKGDSGFVFKAAAQASKAVEFILSFSRVPEPEPEPALA